jgi:hypothetical protein
MRLHVIWKTPTSFTVFELVVVSLFLVTCWHATQMPRSQRAELLMAVLYFSLLCRLLRRLSTQHRALLYLPVLVPPLAYLGLLLSLVVLGTVNALVQLNDNTKLCSTLAVAVGMLVVCFRSRVRSKARRRTTLAPIIVCIRLCLHGFFLLELLGSGLVLAVPLLSVVALSVLLIELTIHRLTYP